jgi:hypothetical protein
MADAGRRKIRGDEPLHSLPLDATMLASPAQSTMPEVAHGEAKVGQGVPVARNSEVSATSSTPADTLRLLSTSAFRR